MIVSLGDSFLPEGSAALFVANLMGVPGAESSFARGILVCLLEQGGSCCARMRASSTENSNADVVHGLGKNWGRGSKMRP
jgi:hypothetical protein